MSDTEYIAALERDLKAMTLRMEAAERLVDIKQKMLLSVAKRADEAEAKIEQFDRMRQFIRNFANEVKVYLESEE